MTDIVIRNATKHTLNAPAGGVMKSVRARFEIEPRDGQVLVYFAPYYADPMRIAGPISVVDIPTPEPEIYIQLVSGAKSVRVATLGYRDAAS